MQNIKLLDLQTGKYLELGNNDFFYGGKYVIILGQEKSVNIILYKDWGKILKYDKQQDVEPHTDPIINEIAEKVGAVIYGGRYVLLENEKCGNIYCEKNKWGTVYYLNKNIYSFIPCLEFNPQNDKKQTVARFFSLDNCQDDLIGNIFEEYSKQLRNESNKFEEFLELIK